MSPSPSKHRGDRSPLFLDASVIINLVGSGHADTIIDALNCPVLIEENVHREFKRHPRDGRDSRTAIDALVSSGRLTLVRMTPTEFDRFLAYTGAPPPNDLGDGEAATLACAFERGSAAIDDRKASRIAADTAPHVKIYCSMDLMCAASVVSALTQDKVRQAILDALKYARMHIPQEWRPWIREMIGTDPRGVVQQRFFRSGAATLSSGSQDQPVTGS